MIFKDILNQKTEALSPEFDKLLKLAFKNQTHFADLLLIHINGFYNPEVLLFGPEKLNPHVIGPNYEGASEHAHYSFIHKYRIGYIHQMSHTEYVKQFVMDEWNEEISNRNNEIIEAEETSIQLEMLIYLKFWEADMIIKKFYQFVRLLNKQHYDWHFKISESSRDKNCTGKRQDIIRVLIRDKLSKHSPYISELIKDTYKTQIRNSIAHSNYSFQGRYIHPNNYIKGNPHSQLKSLSFDDWIHTFHNTIVLYNEYIHMNNLINEHYAEMANKNNNELEIQVTETSGKKYTLPIIYRPEWKDWYYKQN